MIEARMGAIVYLVLFIGIGTAYFYSGKWELALVALACAPASVFFWRLSRSLRARTVLEGKSPNTETLAAMQELEDGGFSKFATVDDLMKDLNSDA